MFWIYLTIFAYFLEAVVFIIDKALLAERIPNPISYAFYVAVISVLAVFLIPLGVHIIGFNLTVVAAFSGASFFFGLIYLYKAVKTIDLLEAAPAVGAITALATFFLTVYVVGQPVRPHELTAFVLLIIGSLVMSYFHLGRRVILHIILAGVLFGASFASLKLLYLHVGYVDGVFWSRIGMVGAALLLLIPPSFRRQITQSYQIAPSRSRTVFILNKFLAGGAFLLIYLAVKLGNVVFVNALQGLQYVFTILIGLILAKRLPSLFEKHIHDHLWRKILATVLIFAGLYFLFV